MSDFVFEYDLSQKGYPVLIVYHVANSDMYIRLLPNLKKATMYAEMPSHNRNLAVDISGEVSWADTLRLLDITEQKIKDEIKEQEKDWK